MVFVDVSRAALKLHLWQLPRKILEFSRGDGDTWLLLHTHKQRRDGTRTSRDIYVATIFRDFDELWKSMSTDERVRILGLLIERIDHDGNDSSVTISFRETGLEVVQ